MKFVDDYVTEPAPLMTLERVRASMRNTKHLVQSLVNARIQRYYFDASNPEDRMVYLIFSKTGKWTKQYYFEMPDQTAVAMCQRKLLEYVMQGEVEKAQPIIDSINASKANRIN
jgi:hypothetical protein